MKEKAPAKKPYTGSKRNKPASSPDKGKKNFDKKSAVVEKRKPLVAQKKTVEKIKPIAKPFVDKGLQPSDDSMRLNRYLAHAGIAARRKADLLIASGVVTVNNLVVKEMGYRVKPTDVVKFKGKIVKPKTNFVYILLNKPKDTITTASDEKGRKTVLEIVASATDERIFPVGRLDRNTTGVLLLTNDGDMAQKLSHPSFEVDKIYHATLDKPLLAEHFEKIKKGVTLEDGFAKVNDLGYPDLKDRTQVGIEIHIGKNRIVRRLFEHFGYQVVKLDRVMYAGLTKKDLTRGRHRILTELEIAQLRKKTN